jgi:predicted ATP-dependent Lon-type protease
LKDGDKVAFIERNGQYILINPVLLAIREVQEAYDGEAEKLGLKDIDDVVDMVKEIREVRKKD